MLLKYMVKQRLTKMTQMLIRMRILSLKTREKVMSSMPMRDMKRELRREEKTKIAAVLDKAIETLKSVYYPDIPNSLEKNVEVEEEEEEEVLLFFFSKQSIKHFEAFGLVVLLVKINILKIVYYNVLELLFLHQEP
ncbi:unnamed protein product [Brassica rapa subsp. narinosa]|uniref:(rape) hypothetical protein n=1 Tax=Brassica napus TaxID=3708 RepID=A0A816XZQ5_BRANA|nr:unnamed protein product [Brassica napus]